MLLSPLGSSLCTSRGIKAFPSTWRSLDLLCVSDFDQDGWQDIYFVNGRDRYDRGIVVKNALYRNNGDNTFTDVTDRAGVPGTGYGLGCA
jgi:hypothetical protein